MTHPKNSEPSKELAKLNVVTAAMGMAQALLDGCDLTYEVRALIKACQNYRKATGGEPLEPRR